jgi:hypothetical protein
MKNILLIVFVLMTSLSFAQTEKGNFLVGGNAGFQSNSNNTTIAFSPNVGYFVKNNFAVGALSTLSSVKQDFLKTTTFNIGPFARYYVGHSNFKPFGLVQVAYLSYTVKDLDPPTSRSSIDGFGFTVGVGGSAFISRDVAFEGILGYNSLRYATADPVNNISLSFGFQIFINSHIKNHQ